MKRRRPILFLLAFILTLSQRELRAQSIPLMIPHSGTVSVGGTPFNGNGQFKFAIVNGNTDCNLAPPGPACTTFWSNDNTSVNGSEPTAAVTLPVTNGAFAVKLGDTTLANMVAIPTTVFTNAQTFLRIWFNDGATGSQQLTPDRQLVTVPYAYQAETANSVSSANVSGMPAVKSAPGGFLTVGTTAINVNSITVTPPSNGFIILTGDGKIEIDQSAVGSTGVEISLTTTSGGTTPDFTWAGYNNTGSATAQIFVLHSFSLTRVFPATGGTAQTFFMTAIKAFNTGTSSTFVNGSSLTAVFVPNALP